MLPTKIAHQRSGTYSHECHHMDHLDRICPLSWSQAKLTLMKLILAAETLKLQLGRKCWHKKKHTHIHKQTLEQDDQERVTFIEEQKKP